MSVASVSLILMKPTSSFAAVAAIVGVCLAPACGSDATRVETATVSTTAATAEASTPTTATTSPAAVTQPSVIDVDPADYAFDSGRFRFELAGSPLRECFIYPAPELQASCSVEWPEGTQPAAEGGSPFTGAPNAIVLTSRGYYPSTSEAGPGDARLLPVNSRIRVGDIGCTAVPGGVDCANPAAGFSFVDDVLDTRGQQTTPAAATTTTAPIAPGPPMGGTDGVYTEGTGPAPLGTMCGAATGHPVVVQVRAGSISCTDALSVMDRYNALPTGEHGNANIQQFDGWSCASPTAVRAKELGYGQVCHSGDIEIVNPNTGR